MVRGSVSITGALGERRNASMRLRAPEGVTLEPKDLDDLTIDYPGHPYRAAARALDPVAYWTLDEAFGEQSLLLPPAGISVFDSSVVDRDTDPLIAGATPGCLLSFKTLEQPRRRAQSSAASPISESRIEFPTPYVNGSDDLFWTLLQLGAIRKFSYMRVWRRTAPISDQREDLTDYAVAEPRHCHPRRTSTGRDHQVHAVATSIDRSRALPTPQGGQRRHDDRFWENAPRSAFTVEDTLRPCARISATPTYPRRHSRPRTHRHSGHGSPESRLGAPPVPR